MGSVTVFFIAPLIMVWMFFGSVFGAITGQNQTKVELPYDEEKGLVWECDMPEAWFSLEDTKTYGDKQIFVFKGSSVFNDREDIYDWFEIVFTAENGETVTYFAARDNMYFALEHKVSLYSPDEYDMITYTPKADFPVDGAQWYVVDNGDVYKTETIDGEETYTFVCMPNGNGKSELENELVNQGKTVYENRFEYMRRTEDDKWEWHERIFITYVLENGEATITQESRSYYVDGKWTEVKPEIQ